MPSLAQIALRYLVWVIALRLLQIAATQAFGLVATPATLVILVCAPAAEIGMRVRARAPGPIALGDWARIWGVMMSVYLLLHVVVPAILVPQMRALLASPEGMRTPAVIAAAVAAMLALFLWLGARAGARSGGQRGA